MALINCSECGKQISDKAISCPHCGAPLTQPAQTSSTENITTKIPKKKKNWPLRVFVTIIVLIMVNGMCNHKDSSNSSSASNSSSSISSEKKVEEAKPIEYIKVSKDALDKELKNNAAVAKEKYNKQYLEITGKLGTIDADLKYISVVSVTDNWDFNGVHCLIKNAKQKEVVKTLTSDQPITVRGQITSVGEIFGYSLDLIEILK